MVKVSNNDVLFVPLRTAAAHLYAAITETRVGRARAGKDRILQILGWEDQE